MNTLWDFLFLLMFYLIFLLTLASFALVIFSILAFNGILPISSPLSSPGMPFIVSFGTERSILSLFGLGTIAYVANNFIKNAHGIR